MGWSRISASAKHIESANKPQNLGLVLAVYLLGLLIGGLYVGMVAPVRTVIQEGFGIPDTDGIWMINIYTLFYAALIPVIGKLADNHGRKLVFTACSAIFCIGAVLCGLSAFVGGFPLLLIGRTTQAVGAGGMIPVANAEMGTAFPPEKRGMALGMAAAVAGIANVLGAAVGSALLALFGNANWSALFFVAIPFCLLVIAGAIKFLPNHTVESTGKLDALGAGLFTLFVLMLLLGLKGVDFFDIAGSFSRVEVWLPLIGAVICFLVFRQVEKRAEDPVFHMEYFHSRPIVITMAVSFFIGASVISMMLVPQLCEFALGLTTGSGGYYVMALGIFSMFGPPVAGKMIDRFGAKPILMSGLVVMIAGFVFLALVAAVNPTPILMIFGLAVVGLGMGFAMGAPCNYMILENTNPADSNSAIATITLVRQIGTSLAPAILVGFISASSGIVGYQQMLLAVAVFNVISFVLMLFYRSNQD